MLTGCLFALNAVLKGMFFADEFRGQKDFCLPAAYTTGMLGLALALIDLF